MASGEVVSTIFNEIDSSQLFEVPFQTTQLKKYQGIKVAFPEQPTELTFLYVRHEDAGDVPDETPQLLEGTDTLLLEGLRWTDHADAAYKGFSRGETTDIGLYSNNGFNRKLIELILGLEKPVTFCDLKSSKKVRASIDESQKPIDFDNTSGPQHVIALQKNAFYRWMKADWFPRDKYMISNLHRLTVEPHAERTGQETVRGLFIVGAGHYTVAEALKSKIAAANLEDKHTIKEIVMADPTPEKYKLLLYRQFIQGETISNSFVGKMLLQGVIRESNLLSPEQKAAGYATIDSLSDEEVPERMWPFQGTQQEKTLGALALVNSTVSETSKLPNKA